MRTGRPVFTFPDGAFNPVIADQTAIYLDGYGEMYQMLARSGVASRSHPPIATVHHRTRGDQLRSSGGDGHGRVLCGAGARRHGH